MTEAQNTSTSAESIHAGILERLSIFAEAYGKNMTDLIMLVYDLGKADGTAAAIASGRKEA